MLKLLEAKPVVNLIVACEANRNTACNLANYVKDHGVQSGQSRSYKHVKD
jgi:hypothetical protein